MKEENKIYKNHWTTKKIEDATKKINKDIYKRNRQAPIHVKLDDLSIFINDKITRRGIAKGLVNIQEDIRFLMINKVERYFCIYFLPNFYKYKIYKFIA